MPSDTDRFTGAVLTGDMLREAILAEFDLRPDESAVLDAACRIVDEIESLEFALAETVR